MTPSTNKLEAFLTKLKPLIVRGELSQRPAAAMATKALGFKVTDRQIRTTAKSLGIRFRRPKPLKLKFEQKTNSRLRRLEEYAAFHLAGQLDKAKNILKGKIEPR